MDQPRTSQPSEANTPHFHMVNVGGKPITFRQAWAEGSISVGPHAFNLIARGKLPKGDCLSLAETAGILAAKKASDLIPLCHPLPLEEVKIKCDLDATQNAINVHCIVSTHAKTGVEMEALAGVQGALLTIYDLAKQVEPALTISTIRLNRKEGGKGGVWLHPAYAEASMLKSAQQEAPVQPLVGIRAAVITVSDRASEGAYKDKSGPLLIKELQQAGATVLEHKVLPDDEARLTAQLTTLIEQKAYDIILTTGGTGLSPRDRTPDVLLAIGERTVPGIGELLRSSGARFTPYSWLSRSIGVIKDQTLLVALPGSAKAMSQSVAALAPLLSHAVNVIRQKDDHV